jgi:hypothetical protein
MIPPDQEIYEVEKRIAERRHRVEAAARASARQAMRALTSPWALVGAAAIGFLVAGGVRRRHEAASSPAVSKDTKEKAKGGAIASLGMAAATWFIKAQFGSPVAMAQYFLAKIQKRDKVPAAAPSSLRADRVMATTRR